MENNAITLWPGEPSPPKRWTEISAAEARKIFAGVEQTTVVESRDTDTGRLLKTTYSSWDCAIRVICQDGGLTELWDEYMSPHLVDPRQILLVDYCRYVDPKVLRQYLEDCPPSAYSSRVVPAPHSDRAYICKTIIDVLYRMGHDVEMYCTSRYIAPIRKAAYAALCRCYRSCRQADREAVR